MTHLELAEKWGKWCDFIQTSIIDSFNNEMDIKYQNLKKADKAYPHT